MDLFETILYDKELKNFDLHLKRVKRSCEYLRWQFKKDEWEELKDKFEFKNKPLKIRVTYNAFGIKSIELFEIKKREFNKFYLKEIDCTYFLKKRNRECLKENTIFLKSGLITDFTFANVAFFDSKNWITPKYPLLKGTKREELLNKGVLKEVNIKKADLKYFSKMALINAILGFFVIEKFDIIE